MATGSDQQESVRFKSRPSKMFSIIDPDKADKMATGSDQQESVRFKSRPSKMFSIIDPGKADKLQIERPTWKERSSVSRDAFVAPSRDTDHQTGYRRSYAGSGSVPQIGIPFRRSEVGKDKINKCDPDDVEDRKGVFSSHRGQFEERRFPNTNSRRPDNGSFSQFRSENQASTSRGYQRDFRERKNFARDSNAPFNKNKRFDQFNQEREQRSYGSPLQRLQNLESEDSYDVLQALSSSNLGLLAMYQQNKISDNQVEIMITVLEKACQCKHSPQRLSKLLQAMNDSGFLSRPVVQYITASSLKQSLISAEVVVSLVEILKVLMHHLPSSSSNNVVTILSQLNHWIRKSPNKEEMEPLLQCVKVAEEMRSDIVKEIRGGDIVRDQDMGDNVDEEPPDDFRKISIMPTAAEIKSDEPPFLRKNIIFGAYKSADHYLDVQYRLLREDFVCPLREGLKMLQSCKDKNMPIKKITDIRFYSRVQILMPYCTNKGIMYRTKFDVTQFKKVRWESSKRLMYGSLVGLSKDDFNNIIFGTVIDRQPDDLRKGAVDLFFEDESAEQLDPNPYTEYQMVECSAYFEAYRHVLKGLQETEDESLPFKKYLLNDASSCKDVEAPRYLRGQDVRYDFSCLIQGSSVRIGTSMLDRYARLTGVRRTSVLDLKEWPSAEQLKLDKSQYAALQTAITKEFVTIQGPPGTGKTYIGLKIVQLLLNNKQSWCTRPGSNTPILVVCYTNHALDQFLEGIIGLCDLTPGDLVRVGGRISSDNKHLIACSIKDVKRMDDTRVSANVQNGIAEAMQQFVFYRQQITEIASQIEGARKSIVHEMFLQQFMTQNQAQSLYSRGFGNQRSVLPIWLELFDQKFPVEDENVQNANEEENVMEDDPEEVRRIQEERMMDETAFTSQRKEHLREIKEKSEQCKDLVNEENWSETSGRGKKKKVKTFTRKNLGFQNMMTVEEAIRVQNVWALPIKERWRLYNFWASCYCEERSLHLRSINAEYNRLASQLAELNDEEDFLVLKKASVIGMTTTGAAKYRHLLHRVQPRIVIVEEAAEVMEAHVVTTLSQRCEHLIMIGDHQQLRPNPTVYKLAKQFHLDISLFERMVKNDLRCDKLTIQHRMRPEIVKLIVPHVYKHLEDHESVSRYENIKGIVGNLFFVKHSYEECSVDDTKSHSNLHEAKFLAALTTYLIKQGYAPEQITVLTTYTGQMFLLRQFMPKSNFEGVRITPVDNYQGEENDIILLSLVRSNEEGKIGFLQTRNRVCVALSRAKMGLYVIGNMELMSEASILWSSIVRYLTETSKLVDALPLACQNHPDTVIHVKMAEDFEKSPEGGCMRDCGVRLDCGHVCRLKCHPRDLKHEEYKCTKRCLQILCNLQHQCPKLCHEKCTKCEVLVEKTIPNCGHKQMVKCHVPETKFICHEPCQKILPCGHKCRTVCGKECTTMCTEIIPSRLWPDCGHYLSVECFYCPDTFLCNVQVEKRLPCGHAVTMDCSGDIERMGCLEMESISLCGDKFHTTEVACYQVEEFRKKKCEFKVKNSCPKNEHHVFITNCYQKETEKCPLPCNAEMICGHRCNGKCGICSEGNHQSCKASCARTLACGHQCKGSCGAPCPPCNFPCNFFCGHGKCSHQCSELCTPCELQCRWNCVHIQCDRLCMEPCTRAPCDEPCQKMLNCRHPCLGLCGELCPPICRICKQHKQRLQQSIEFFQIKDFGKKTRFLLLQPCGHMVEVGYMDRWVEESKPKTVSEPTCLTCPICKSLVGFCPRYNSWIKTYMIQMNDVKRMSTDANRLRFQINNAVSTIWPSDGVSDAMNRLTSTETEEDKLKLQRLARGAACVWLESFKVLQICKRKNANVEMEAESLEKAKTELISAFQLKSLNDLGASVIALYKIYLLMHTRRLQTFIKDPRKVYLLKTIGSELTKESDVNWLELATTNIQLGTNFSLKQKENVDDYMKYLESFFNPVDLNVRKWLICSQGHAFAVCEDIWNIESLCKQCHPQNVKVSPVYSIPIRELVSQVLQIKLNVHRPISPQYNILDNLRRATAELRLGNRTARRVEPAPVVVHDISDDEDLYNEIINKYDDEYDYLYD